MIHEYKTGRTICGFVEFVSWLLLIIAAIVLLISLGKLNSSSGFSAVFAAQALVSIISLLLAILVIHIARAAMDGSVAAQKMVIETRKHHVELVSAIRSISSPPASAADEQSYRSRNVEPAPIPERKNQAAPVARTDEMGAPFETYRDFRIYIDRAGARVGDRGFLSRDKAERYIEELYDLEQRLVRDRSGEVVYRKAKITFSAGAFVVNGRIFAALPDAAHFLDDQLQQSETIDAPEEPLKLFPNDHRTAKPHPKLVEDRRPPEGLG